MDEEPISITQTLPIRRVKKFFLLVYRWPPMPPGDKHPARQDQSVRAHPTFPSVSESRQEPRHHLSRVRAILENLGLAQCQHRSKQRKSPPEAAHRAVPVVPESGSTFD